MSSLAVSSKPSLSGPDKAAAFLLLAGKEAATRLADYFSEEELRAVFVAAERLQSLTVEEMEALAQRVLAAADVDEAERMVLEVMRERFPEHLQHGGGQMLWVEREERR